MKFQIQPKLAACLMLLLGSLGKSLYAQNIAACPTASQILEYEHRPSGVHVYTGCSNEQEVLNGLSSIFRSTGVGFPQLSSSAAQTGVKPLKRVFFEPKSGTNFLARHFYTVDEAEYNLAKQEQPNNPFTPIAEGDRALMFGVQGLIQGASDLETLQSYRNTTYCEFNQIPVYRYFINQGRDGANAQHRFTAYWKTYRDLANRYGSDGEEGIRFCAPYVQQALVRNAVISNSNSTTGSSTRQLRFSLSSSTNTSRTNTYVLLNVPNGLTVSDIRCAVASGINQTYRCGPFDAPSSTSSPLVVTIDLPISGDFSANDIKLRAYVVDSSLSPEEVVKLNDPNSCRAEDRPAHGCAIAVIQNSGLEGSNLNVEVSGLQTIGEIQFVNNRGNGQVRFNLITNQPLVPIYYRLVQRVGNVGAWLSLGESSSTPITLQALQTGVQPPGFNDLAEGASIAVCLSRQPISARECGQSSGSALSAPIGPFHNSSSTPSISFRTSPEFLSATAGQGYVFDAYCEGSNLVPNLCTVRGLPTGLTANPPVAVNANSIRVMVSGTLDSSLSGNYPFIIAYGSFNEVTRLININPAQQAVRLKPIIGNIRVTNKVTGNPNRADISFELSANPNESGRYLHYQVFVSGRGSGITTVQLNGGILDITLRGLDFGSNSLATFKICAADSFNDARQSQCDLGDSASRTVTPLQEVSFGPPPPPPAAATASWTSLPASADREVGKTATWTLSVNSANSSNPITGPVTAYVTYPAGFEFVSSGSSTECQTTNTQRTLSCVIQTTGSLTTAVARNLQLKLAPGSGGTSRTVIAHVVNSAVENNPAPATCSSSAQGCAHGTIDVVFYDLRPQSASINSVPTATQSVSAACQADGTAAIPSAAKCRIELGYTDSSTPSTLEQPYDVSSRQRSFKICANGSTEAGCDLTVPAGKTLSSIKLTAVDAASPDNLDNDPTNNSRTFNPSSGAPPSSCSDQVSQVDHAYPLGYPTTYAREYFMMNNGDIHVVQFTPHPSWNTVNRSPSNFSPYIQWGMNSAYADRTVSISRCKGHFTRGPDTPLVFSGYDGYQGRIYFVVDDPVRAALTGAVNLVGLSADTKWYVNFRQDSCSVGRCQLFHALTP